MEYTGVGASYLIKDPDGPLSNDHTVLGLGGGTTTPSLMISFLGNIIGNGIVIELGQYQPDDNTT